MNRLRDGPPVNSTKSDRTPFDSDRIAEQLRLVDLAGRENNRFGGEFQSHVVQPNVTAIIDKFHATLSEFDEFRAVFTGKSDSVNLKDVHRSYLLTLAVGFQQQAYFEDRFQIGLAHQYAGVSLRFYQSTYRLLQSLLVESIPQKIRQDPIAFDSFVQFILKITALDMSLAIEAYHRDTVSHLEKTVDAARNEGQQLRQQLITDSLTSVSSRAFSLDSVATALRRARSETMPLCLLMADLDHFKDINDTLGHRVGDEVLCGVASRMLAGARKVDTVGRYGGDEFVFILRDADMEESIEIADRIRLKVSEHPLHVGNSTVEVTLSLGIARARDDDDLDSFIKRADLALYSAKLSGRNCVRIEGDNT